MEKRITIKVHPDLHQEIKRKANEKRITMTLYVKRALWEQIRKEKQYE